MAQPGTAARLIRRRWQEMIMSLTSEDSPRHTYDRWANTYDRRWQRYSERTHDFLLEQLAYDPGGAILDVGCGTGTLLQCLSMRSDGTRLFGIDASAGMLRVARRKLAGHAVDLRLGPACQVPFPSAAMDLVIMASMLHYLKRPSVACAEARRVLRPGGTLAIVDYLPRGLRGSAIDGLIRRYDRGHVRSRTRAELVAILIFAGFQEVSSADFQIDRLYHGVFAKGRA